MADTSNIERARFTGDIVPRQPSKPFFGPSEGVRIHGVSLISG